jgi:hypothetical protein
MTCIARGGLPADPFDLIALVSSRAFSRCLAIARSCQLACFWIALRNCFSRIVTVVVIRVFDSQTEQEHGSCDNAVGETNGG